MQLPFKFLWYRFSSLKTKCMDHAINYHYIPERRRMQGGDGLYSRMSSAHMFREAQDAEFEHKTKKVAEKISEGMNIVANEPSLAFFRIQEHVRKSLPQLVQQKHEVQELQQRVQGASFDTEYATNAVKGLHKSNNHFQNIQDLLKNAMFMKQQIDYEQDRRDQEKVRPSMYGTAKQQSSASGGRHSLPSTPTTSSPGGSSLNTPTHTTNTPTGRRSRSLPPSKLSSSTTKGTGSPKCIHTSL
ncbi:BLOC-1-related complex subunit 8 homolog isoform X1 [Mizuhopecten yessoensis]|uniref:BLOC-1-related complex subunit 8 homolog isoform X1 n=1 Tax=Mizuhopecten yessoensis TaxID=6573 RepID=UPI000B457AC1|nr:BLOC-1-related complex subunit 8 homolog isoform X1 [Mizuhopecten yessoensis]